MQSKSTRGRTWNRGCRKRLSTALAVSLLLHGLVARNPSGNPSPRRTTVSDTRPVSATLAVVLAARTDISAQAELVENAATVAGPTVSSPHVQRISRRERLPDRVPEDRGMTADTRYYGVQEIDVFPSLASASVQAPPGEGHRMSAGHALVLVLIDQSGQVDEVEIIEAEPAPHFGDEVRRSLLSSRFTPALRNGRAVKSRVIVRVEYERPQR